MASLATPSSTLPLLLVLLLAAAAASAAATTITVTNKCAYTVWPAAVPPGEGAQLETGETWSVRLPAGAKSAVVWGRTGCGFVSGGKLGQCQTGDCGGVLQCKSLGAPPTTLAEFTLAGGGGGAHYSVDRFDVSLLQGFNAPMTIVPAGGGCPRGGLSCPAQEITFQCPSELRAKAGCNNPCRTFGQDKYCCTGAAASSCGPTDYSFYFKRFCPEAITYPKDVGNTTYTCPAGTDYHVVFCP